MIVLNLAECAVEAHTISVTTVTLGTTVLFDRHFSRFNSLVTIHSLTTVVFDHESNRSAYRTSRAHSCHVNSGGHILTHTSTDYATQLVQHQSFRQRGRYGVRLNRVRHSRSEHDRRVDKVEWINVVAEI